MITAAGAAPARSLQYVPVVELLPDPARLRLLVRVRLGAAAAR